MKIGYACINRTLACKANATFRLASFTDDKFIQTVANNLDGLLQILKFNLEHHLLFFRISSDIIPFASHPICTIPWQAIFAGQLKTIGDFIKKHHMRISMHPSQFVLINSPQIRIVENAIRDLNWHCELLDVMGLKVDAKVQIHVGGVYNDKPAAIARFIHHYNLLPQHIKNRLVIENDDRLFSLADCLNIHKKINIPIIFDNLHHDCLHHHETMRDGLQAAAQTWQKKDGVLMVDYSTQAQGEKTGKHAQSIDIKHFERYLRATQGIDFDIMLEIKDKEPSALQAYQMAMACARV